MTNASERTYEAILDLILDGEFAPGARLREEDLAATLGVSRTPVREALGRLSAEGYLRFQRNRGAEIVKWSRDDIEEIYDLRAMLEGYAARRAAHSDVDRGRLRILSDKMQQLVADQPERVSAETWREIAALNGEFHRIIIAAAGSPRLQSILLTLLHAPLVLQTYSHYRSAGLLRSFGHHREVIEAFDARDPEWAESVLHTHVFHARAVLLEAWEQARADRADPDDQAGHAQPEASIA